MSTHTLKCWPDYFNAIAEGRKNFEVRYDDRGFQAGDKVMLQEYNPNDLGGRFTGRVLHADIGYVLANIPPRSANAFTPGYVAFSLLNVRVSQR